MPTSHADSHRADPVTPTQTDAEQGALTASDELAVAHVALVGHIVRETLARVPSHVDRDDLNSAGLLALVTASRAYDPSRGIPFGKYAATRIRGALKDELRSLDWASRGVRRRGREIESTRASLATSIRQVPDNAQVAEALGLSVAELRRSEDDIARASILSLDVASDLPFAEVLPSCDPAPDVQLVQREQLEFLDAAVEELPDRLKHVIRGYFIDERPMAELAEDLGVTESRISQLRAEALGMLRDGLNSALDPDLVAVHMRPDGCAARRRGAYYRAVAERHAAANVGEIRPVRRRPGARASRRPAGRPTGSRRG